ncbi:hypothetical protein SAMN00120144_2105 [Hymenobacter roseosalivarius DSM 11622]|uniref:DUF3871 family protein n=1 Tax=Hymenobacter roseosalivarius DSM 11622 TaxID=645990 RepID=A0A1W1VFK0_9BACT|nr:DUF3871 family protein [Hymenobacter roseosalivarius]SMB92158.1 hypothetical protein SAMN00120144_2105 [Hymenobacter roseosalivarius DSM 11622]
METLLLGPNARPLSPPAFDREPDPQASGSRAFIEANTLAVDLQELRHQHTIPVFVKDNEPLISQADFIDVTQEAMQEVFRGEQILLPQVRVSHPIKGRIPEAKHKPATQLEDWERTLYYERMMFCVEVPTLFDTIEGNRLTLQVGGVKAYNLDNLYHRKGAAEHFKLFVGFQNTVCTNLCVRTDGYRSDVRVSSLEQLRVAVYNLLQTYDQHRHLTQLQQLGNYALTEAQFALLIGRCRLYQFLPAAEKKNIPPLLYGDQQLAAVCRDYYRDQSFCRDKERQINLWRLYNLFTGANKSTYIDQFLDRTLNALEFAGHVQESVGGGPTSWYLT